MLVFFIGVASDRFFRSVFCSSPSLLPPLLSTGGSVNYVLQERAAARLILIKHQLCEKSWHGQVELLGLSQRFIRIFGFDGYAQVIRLQPNYLRLLGQSAHASPETARSLQ